ncbi:fumarylacetoacetase [Balneola sp. MJW-20]|uniref:fumarylacetoacetase n=1 Tax=Gracilimonas aurantiaca TaxID=3234185 RepID=UPI00346724DB
MQNSFIEIKEDSHFPIQNLPYSAFQTHNGEIHLCSAIGDYLIDLFVLDEAGLFDGPKLEGQFAFQDSSLNYFMSLGKEAWKEARATLQDLFSADNEILQQDELLRDRVLIPMNGVEMVLPMEIGDYTDFYSSEQHAFNVGTMFRGPENALMPNWKHLPVGYHGRASSIILSGKDVRRPKGQILPQGSDTPVYDSCKLLDFELEMGFVTGVGNELGSRIDVNDAEEHIFGLVLVNDWSARDIQKWEYQPLGPFLAKNFATSISPWIVSLEALEPFRRECKKQDPEPLEYLQQSERSTFDIDLEVAIQSDKMTEPRIVCRSNYQNLYWTMSQQLAHQTVTGCNVRPGDLYASGTISGPTEDSYGSMLELAWKGTKPVSLGNGEERTFLQDGDRVIMRGYAQGEGYRVGFGEVNTKILPSH